MVGLIAGLAAISAGLITAVNLATKERIALNAEVKLKQSVLNVFGATYESGEAIEVFDKLIKLEEVNGQLVYKFYQQGEVSALAFEMKGPGFWGAISALIAISPDLNTIYGVEIVAQEETPGLGGRITESEFKAQFKQKPVTEKISIDAITGATMTSKAFEKIVNQGVHSFRKNFEDKLKVN